MLIMLFMLLFNTAVLPDVLIFFEGLQDVGDGSYKLGVLVSVG